ncbi:MAG: tRNA (adenosine(37)-N6)-threonylcarbamoyltransferase complex transferase subunit TsaD [Candidatus Sungbacteria bacterium]|uniref:tRNA N6-adenosine threonylcarbamoyltransferase n=1 Tax=Candidatus Sungiibacteriota bacterium TaxID=2750080 RepID=A0A9D6QYL4_9BACT|nr:tRNA (adenosine(37)-N6)-threonylcarbamoyltransferase complex transferase subunit TsaD [Candidatus Sungbacteria bacterium]
MRILAIETSCDETAIAVLEADGRINAPKFKPLANVVSSQIAIHAKFGGVVPNLAKREHEKNLVPVLKTALKEARLYRSSANNESKTNKRIRIFANNSILADCFSHEPELFRQFKKEIPKIEKPAIDVIAVTYGPGLAPALWTGVNFAKGLARVWQVPLVSVNHLAGHIYVNLLHQKKIDFPALALIVSGGHTELVLMKKHGAYQIIGETRDDAAGEAFDKVAKLLGLTYPGGPQISRLAEKFRIKNKEPRIRLPRPMIDSPNFDFSFSGLKTAVLYKLRELTTTNTEFKTNKRIRIFEGDSLFADIAHEFQNAVVEVLVKKTIAAARKYGVKTFILGGGVAANKKLRKDLAESFSRALPTVKVFLPHPKETTDNGLMIAVAAYYQRNKKAARSDLRAEPALRLA